MENPGTFEMESHGVKMVVEELKIPGRTVFRVVFSSKRESIVIVRALGRNKEKFWTTVPENPGRQIEAEGVGKLIETYFQSKQS